MHHVLTALVLLACASQAAFAGQGPVTVPEPASMALLAVGAGAVLLARRRRK